MGEVKQNKNREVGGGHICLHCLTVTTGEKGEGKKKGQRHQDTVGAQFNSCLNKRGQIFDLAMDSSILARVCLYYF